jgi:hypothetical protein
MVRDSWTTEDERVGLSLIFTSLSFSMCTRETHTLKL